MKTTFKIAGILIMLMLTFNSSLSAQRGMRGGIDNFGMNRRGIGSDTIHRYGMATRPDSLRMHGMRSEMGPGRYGPHGQFMDHRQMYGMNRGMGPGISQRGRRQAGSGRMILESVPNVTEKQKKEISDLLKKQQDDMKKFREEMSAKIQTIRETNRKSLDNILTEEQRKYIDAKKGNTGTTPAKK
jgi:hypothetical protein